MKTEKLKKKEKELKKKILHSLSKLPAHVLEKIEIKAMQYCAQNNIKYT